MSDTVVDEACADLKKLREIGEGHIFFLKDASKSNEVFARLHVDLVKVFRTMLPHASNPLRLLEDQHECWFLNHHASDAIVPIYEDGEGRYLIPGDLLIGDPHSMWYIRCKGWTGLPGDLRIHVQVFGSKLLPLVTPLFGDTALWSQGAE